MVLTASQFEEPATDNSHSYRTGSLVRLKFSLVNPEPLSVPSIVVADVTVPVKSAS